MSPGLGIQAEVSVPPNLLVFTGYSPLCALRYIKLLCMCPIMKCR